MSGKKSDETSSIGRIWEFVKKHWWKVLAAYFVLKRNKKKK